MNNQSNQPMPNTGVDPSVFHNNTVYKSIGDGEEGKIPDLVRHEAEYAPEYQRFTEFFSTSSVDELFKTVGAYANENAKEFEFDDEEYSTTIKVEVEEQPVTLRVNILKVDEEKHCVEVIKEKGDRFAFSHAYNEIKKFFGGHANATI